MEIATATAPQTTLPKLQLVRNAWLVSILAAVALVAAIVFVALLSVQSNADMFVLVGVAGSAYIVLQCWSLLVCTRALRESSTFISPYFAAVASLLLFNVFLLGIHFSRASGIRPIREGLQMTALPVLVPIATLAFLITLPLARRIAHRRAISSERSKRILYGGTFTALLLLLMPVPLFIYLAQFISLRKPDNRYDPPVRSLWTCALRATPEFVADLALTATHGTRWYANILRTGRPSTDRLQFESHMSLNPNEALDGLCEKEPALALVVANELARANGSMVKPATINTAAKIIADISSASDLVLFLKDPEVLPEFRESVIRRRFIRMDQKLTEEMARTPGVQMGPYALNEFVINNEENVILDVWKSWIQEKNQHRALGRAKLCGAVSSELGGKLFVECMDHGGGTMRYALLTQTNADRIQFEDEDRNLVLAALLRRLEDGKYHGIETSDAVCRLSGLPRPLSFKSMLDTRALPGFIQQLRAFLASQQVAR